MSGTVRLPFRRVLNVLGDGPERLVADPGGSASDHGDERDHQKERSLAHAVPERTKPPRDEVTQKTIDKNQQNKQGSVMIRAEMGAPDLTSLTMPALEEGTIFFELGMKYVSGRSGPADLVAAHNKWFNVAFARGCRTAARCRSESRARDVG